jgi:hypothetical protein
MSSRVIPVERRRGIVNFDQLLGLAQEFNLGSKVISMLEERGHGLIEKIKPIITKHATDENGEFNRNWKDLTALEKASLVEIVHKREPLLERHFQGGWATDWALKKSIDQRVADRKRRQKCNKLVIYPVIKIISHLE